MFIHCPTLELKPYERVQINDKRHYRTPHGDFPSITTVLSISDTGWLDEWKERVGEKEANRISSVSRGRGTNLHQMCEDYLNNKPLSCKFPDALEMFYSLKPILTNRINNIHHQEKALYSKKLKIAGTVDVIAEFDGILSIIDFKNSRRVKTVEQIHHYILQETFYAAAFYELSGHEIKQLVTIIAVEDGNPLVFVEKIKKEYLLELQEMRKLFSKMYG